MTHVMPAHWVTASLEELTTKIGSGATPRGGKNAYKTVGTPLIRSMNIHFRGFVEDGLVLLDDKQAEKLQSVAVEADDVLLNITGASIGRVTTAPPEMEGARVNQHVSIIRSNGGFQPRFLSHYLASTEMQREIMETQSGATRQALTKGKIGNFQIPVPPLNEQRRIADKIDALQAKSRRAREALEAVGPLLEKFRQSVLAAAFRGDLTAEWRKQHPDVEPAEKLLERIRTERRTRWEEAELAKMRSKGIKPKDDKWKAKYTEPEPVDATGLPELPEGWCWVTLSELELGDRQTSYGVLKPGQHCPDGVRFLKSGQVRHGFLDLSYDHRITQELSEQFCKTVLQGGEVLLNLVGASIGRSAVAPLELRGANVTRAIAVIPVVSSFADWVQSYLQSPWGQGMLMGKVGGSAQPVLNLGEVRSLPVPLAPVIELRPVLDKVSTVKSKTAGIEAPYFNAQATLGKLEQSILFKAFRGELVPQDPNDEPASVLLERIKAEREAAQDGKNRRAKKK